VALDDLADPPARLVPRLRVLSLSISRVASPRGGVACFVGTGFSFIADMVT